MTAPRSVPREREEWTLAKNDVKRERHDVKGAKQDLRPEQKHGSDREVREARVDLRDEKKDLRQEKRDSLPGASDRRVEERGHGEPVARFVWAVGMPREERYARRHQEICLLSRGSR